MSMEATIRAKLEAAFPGAVIELRNDSARHAGHAGDDGTGESHWHLVLQHQSLGAMSRVARQRAVHSALGEVMARIHALSMELSA